MTNRSSHLRSMADEDGAAILNVHAGTISTLNTTGAYVWHALERGEDLEAIATNLATESGEPVEVVRKDVEEFLHALRGQDLFR
jgi:Coenzyme PQQ synthesis protein D (PqqD)